MKIKQKKLKALIIGAGRIGSTFDNPNSKKILTHAHAYFKHPNFEIIGFLDSNLNMAKRATKVWGGKAYRNFDEVFSSERIDVVSLCVPDKLHFEFLQKIKAKNIKMGILEKPLVATKAELNNIKKDPYFQRNNFLVNYSRRFVPEFVQIRESILKKEFGNFLSGNCWYGKGFSHNASHIINLLLFFGLNIKESKVLAKIDDYSKNDPSCSVLLKTSNSKNITLNVIDSRKYKVFEIDLFFEKNRVRIFNDGFDIETSTVEEDDVFQGYKKLFLKEKTKTSFDNALYKAVDNLYNMTFHNDENLSSVSSAVKTLDVIFDLK